MRNLAVFGAALASVACAYPARADLKYTQVMHFGDPRAAQMAPVTTTAIRQDQRRVETVMHLGPMTMQTVELTLCKQKQIIKIAPAAKVYTVTAMAAPAAVVRNSAAPVEDKAETGDATGKVISETHVKDLGEEKIADRTTQHYLINSTVTLSGCAGQGTHDMKMEVWVLPGVRVPLACETTGPDPMRQQMRTHTDCKISYEQRGDTTSYGNIFSGLVMRMKMYSGDQVVSTQEVTGLSQAALDDSLFTIPADYKEVSEKDFQAAQQRAMIAAMTNGGGANQGDAGTGQGDGKEDNPSRDGTQNAPADKTKHKPRLHLPGF